MSVLFSIEHSRLLALRWVTATAAKHVNVLPGNPAYEDWEEALKVVDDVVDNITRCHIDDARENGNCEKCDPGAFALAEQTAQHKKELEAFDQQLAKAS